jgi:hypothetical protein
MFGSKDIARKPLRINECSNLSASRFAFGTRCKPASGPKCASTCRCVRRMPSSSASNAANVSNLEPSTSILGTSTQLWPSFCSKMRAHHTCWSRFVTVS